MKFFGIRILRVFPSKTNATPDDDLVRFDVPGMFEPEVDEIHISCTFSWDVPRAKYLYRQWSKMFNECVVKIGGVAFNTKINRFTPGLYLKKGFIITSRGCHRKCSHCMVSEREGNLSILKIRGGWNVLDNNLLACPRNHIDSVFKMLMNQPQAIRFIGGLDIKLCDDWVIEWLLKIRLGCAYFAYDRSDQRKIVEHVVKKILDKSGWSDATARNKLACYVLIGYPKDTISKATERLEFIKNLGVNPSPMFYQPYSLTRRKPSSEWADLTRNYSRAWITFRNQND